MAKLLLLFTFIFAGPLSASGLSRLTCTDSSCADFVGMLTIVKADGKAESCTASLVQDDIVLTNSHCVPKDLKTAGSLCSGRIFLHFAPNSQHPEFEEQLECDHVISATVLEPGKTQRDLAFLKMKHKSLRPTLKIDRSGFSDGESFTLWKVDADFVGERIMGNLSAIQCRSIHGTDVTGSNNPLFPLMAIVDCQVLNGYSGGPILDQTGRARGVIQGFLPMGNARKTSREKGFDLVDGGIAPINLATNLSCEDLPFPSIGFDTQTCVATAQEENEPKSFPAEPSFNLVQQALNKKMSNNILWTYTAAREKRMDSWGGEHSLRILSPTPVCLDNSNTTSPIEIASYILLYGFDQYLRPAIRLANDPQGRKEVFDPTILPECAQP